MIWEICRCFEMLQFLCVQLLVVTRSFTCEMSRKILQPMRVFRPSNVRCSVAIRMILGWLHFRRPCCFPLLICYEATSIWILSHSISTFWGLGVALSGFMWFPWTPIIADWSWPRGCDPMLCRLRFVPWGHQSATWRGDCVVSPNIFDHFEY